MNDNDLLAFPVGLLWMNETKTTRYTQHVYKFTKEIAIQTLLQMVTITEDVSDDESDYESEDEVRTCESRSDEPVIDRFLSRSRRAVKDAQAPPSFLTSSIRPLLILATLVVAGHRERKDHHYRF